MGIKLISKLSLLSFKRILYRTRLLLTSCDSFVLKRRSQVIFIHRSHLVAVIMNYYDSSSAQMSRVALT